MQALNNMENNKSPGIDGLTTNFYKHFWLLIGNKLTCVYKHALTTGFLSVMERYGIITLVFKKWRPHLSNKLAANHASDHRL